MSAISCEGINSYLPRNWRRSERDEQSLKTEGKCDGFYFFVSKVKPVFDYLYDLGCRISGLAIKIIGAIFTGTVAAVFPVKELFWKVQVVMVVFAPFNLYNIVNILRSSNSLKDKCIDLAVEIASLSSIAASVGNWVVQNFHKGMHVLPYLVGVSTLLGVFAIVKKAIVLRKTKQIAQRFFHGPDSQRELATFVKKIRAKTLTSEDKKMLEFAFKVPEGDLDSFSQQIIDTENIDKIKNHLKGRVERSILSQKVFLVAETVELVASILIVTSFFVAPPVAAALILAQGLILSSTNIVKIGMFIFDWKTQESKLVQENLEMQPLQPLPVS